MRRSLPVLLVLLAALAWAASPLAQQKEGIFKGGVDLVRVTATVTDANGRFVQGLRQEDFVVYEDGVKQEITQFSSERAPVSLGILLDVSGSMSEEKMAAARQAIDRFIFELLGKDDELFFVEFAGLPALRQDWTTDRQLISRAVRNARASGDTALYDAIATAIPKAETGRHRKKAVLIISDGNDSASKATIEDVRQAIRESEVLVYALGVDSDAREESGQRQPRRIPTPIPFPVPGKPRIPGIEPPRFPPPMTPPIADTFPRNSEERVDGDALRKITDDTGGFTEIIRGTAGLPSATARIADELSRQYDLGYASNREKDGRWHVIRVEVTRGGRRVTVRARQGYYAL
jgi:Ca-activated chloride channel family protein